MFCSSLPFSTLEHHWWHIEAPKLPANHLSSSALSPSIIRVKGCCASQLMSHSEFPTPLPCTNSQNSLVSSTEAENRNIFWTTSEFHQHLDTDADSKIVLKKCF